MPITLREEVAEAIYKAMPVHTRNWSDIDEPTRADFLCLANAAIVIVLKRAAEVADNFIPYYPSGAEYGLASDGERREWRMQHRVAQNIGTAILSLASKEPTP